MKTKFEKLFPTVISTGGLPGFSNLNRKLMKDFDLFSAEDRMGKKWSKEHYRGGYTSYASLSDMHHRTPNFMELERKLRPYVKAFAKAQGWELKGLTLQMTSCWMNIMGKGTHHTLHHHPQSVISGVYYVSTPAKSVPLKIEDPRMGFFMHAPLKRVRKDQKNNHYFQVPARAGQFTLFESWLRHEVVPNRSVKPRLCISFNYDLTQETDLI